MKIAQFLLTRFNLALRFAPKDIGIDSDWLRARFELFEKICLPSVVSQTEQNFHWILLLNDRTPPPFMVRLVDDLACVASPVLLLLVPQYAEQPISSAIVDSLEPKVDRVVTTRLDNDDGIAREYMAEVRLETSRLPPDGNFVINFPHGCQVARAGIFPLNAVLNPFLSLVSSPGDLKTAFATHHARMNCIGKVIDKTSTSAKWIQVIHSRNLQNHLREGEPCPDSYLHNFTLAKDWQSCL